jgi:hypothetical protein
MAKKKQSKVVQMLSPENYIRQKARTLPVYKCFVNSNWQESGMANVLVARRHTNSNLTFGTYLVDLKCLGVKDAGYDFNVSESDFITLLDRMKMNLDFNEINYILAHNIIYAGLEFAEDFGFKPHRDFTQVAQYILEEDTESIELMDIECGNNGKPLYVSGPFDSITDINKIIATLEKNAGPGNYSIIIGDGDPEYDEMDDEDDDFDDEFDDDIDDEFPELNFTEEEIKNSHTLQLKIAIDDLLKPEVWRRVTVPSYYTFAHLHHLIQFAFDWESCHSYEFSELKKKSKKIIITEINEEDSDELEARKIPVSQFFTKAGDLMRYTYDFGDNWTHTITLEKIIPQPSVKPELLDGKGACPPEDCGGVWGYKNLLQILADKKHPEHQEHRDWLGLFDDENYDPDKFDLEETRELIDDVFSE